MKKLVILCLIGAFLLGLCACSRVTLREDAPVTLRFHYMDVSADVSLPEAEAAQLRGIVEGKALSFDNPSCGFAEDVSFEINGRVFCPACDTCRIIKDCSSGKYLNISQAERELLDQIFANYGGFFPCV